MWRLYKTYTKNSLYMQLPEKLEVPYRDSSQTITIIESYTILFYVCYDIFYIGGVLTFEFCFESIPPLGWYSPFVFYISIGS